MRMSLGAAGRGLDRRGGPLEGDRTEPTITLALSASSLVADDPRVIAALETYLESLRAGRPWSREEFLGRYADIAPALSDCLSGLEFVQAVAAQLGGTDSVSAADHTAPIPPRAQLGDYRILREIGRGGMGVVYEAEQVSLGRQVALKVLPFAAAIDPRQRQRFQIEAQAAAQLHHPHIVPIFAVGCDHGIHHYAMQYVEGRSLAALLHELRAACSGTTPTGAGPATTETAPRSAGVCPEPRIRPACDSEPSEVAPVEPLSAGKSGCDAADPGETPSRTGHALAPTASGPAHHDCAYFRTVARLGAQAADALEHAHSLGVLHRDIKPANLLVDGNGSVWITDFGLARFPGDPGLTQTGDMIGTLRYMSPEQALARRGVVDQRTDIYALGATLYELLTLRPAHDGRDHQELLRQIALDEPVAPRRLNPAVPRDLETIVMKAMAKDAPARYATAGELAADFERFLADRPILARRPSVAERTWRWARRHRIVGVATAIVVLALSVSTALLWAERKKTQAEARKAQKARDQYFSLLAEYYPWLVDLSAMPGISQADGLTLSQPAQSSPEQRIEYCERMLKFFEQATELPATDLERRKIIGRAHNRLGYERAILSMAKGKGSPEPGLLARAVNDYRQSIALFDKLLAEQPGDRQIRHYLADALGVYGLGCCSRFEHLEQEAESYYRRAMVIRRELARTAPIGGTDADETIEMHNFDWMLCTYQILAAMMAQQGRTAEFNAVRQQLRDDIAALSKQFSNPALQKRRLNWSTKVAEQAPPPIDRSARKDALMYDSLAMTLDPHNPRVLNDLAWRLVSFPKDPWYDPARGLALARKAVELDTNNWQLWNTAGVAAFRARDWKSATELLQKSIAFTGGTAHDFFFMAMTCCEQGKKKDAEMWFDRAVAWLNQHAPKDPNQHDPELRQFRAEAAELLRLSERQPACPEDCPAKYQGAAQTVQEEPLQPSVNASSPAANEPS